MSQILLPPPSPQPGSTPPEAQAPDISASSVAMAPATAEASRRPIYAPEPPKPQSRLWRAVKWPLRQLFKVLILMGAAIKRHRVAALVIAAVVLALGGVAFGVYQYTHPATSPGLVTQQGPGTATGGADTPLTIVAETPPPLPPSVLHWLHGHKTGDAQEMWNALSSGAQAAYQQRGGSTQSLQQLLDQEKAAGITYEQYIYTGGFAPLGSDANYTIQVVVDQAGRRATTTWYFVVDPNGQILIPVDLDNLLSQG